MAEKITMYVRSNCSDVNRARHALRARGVEWDEIDIEQDAEAARRVREWTGRAATPVLWIDGVLLVEPDAGQIDKALGIE